MAEYKYDLEEQRIIEHIKKVDAKSVILHLPDGLKPRAEDIQKKIVEATGVDVVIWAGSNFGACDLPVDVERSGVDLIIHFGHSPWLS